MLRGHHSIADIGDCAMRVMVMEFARLGKIEKGSVSNVGKFKSLHDHWFNVQCQEECEGKSRR